MSIYKRKGSSIYWYKFMWHGELIRESTKQGNDKVARNMESAHRTRLAQEALEREEEAQRLACKPEDLARCPNCRNWLNRQVGITLGEQVLCSVSCRTEWGKKHTVVPTLAEFIDNRFEPWAKATFEKASPKTWLDWYRVGLRAIKAYKPLASTRLNEITSEKAADFAAHRQTDGLQVSTTNSSLRVLRRVLRLAVEWGALEAAPNIKMLPGERHRERVVSVEEEAKYLAAAPEPLASVATVLADTGLRPEEAYRLRWEGITWANGRHGTLLVTHGKTAAARRVLPMTPRVRNVLESRWEAAERPQEGWVWPAPTKSGHIEPSSLKKQHAKVFATLKEKAEENNGKPVRRFVLYSLRHTFLTRLGESGCDVWTLARIAGHSNVSISSRYVHPSEDAVLAAMARLGGHKIGHSETEVIQQQPSRPQLTS